jgi:hypothetical protein
MEVTASENSGAPSITSYLYSGTEILRMDYYIFNFYNDLKSRKATP